MRRALVLINITIIMMIASCSKQSPAPDPSSQGPYFPQVKEIIHQNCLSCHTQGGQGMPVILSADSDIVHYAASIKSATMDPVSPTNKRMPLDGELSEADKTIIADWYAAGGTASD